MVLMNENQSDCHRSLQQRFRALRNELRYWTNPDNPDRQARERGVGSHPTPVMHKGQTDGLNRCQMGFTLPG